MFSNGQKIFGIIFIIMFASVLIWSYRKDINLHKIYYKKVWVVALGIVVTIALFAIIAYTLHS